MEYSSERCVNYTTDSIFIFQKDSISSTELTQLNEDVLSILDEVAPLKSKIIKGRQNPESRDSRPCFRKGPSSVSFQ